MAATCSVSQALQLAFNQRCAVLLFSGWQPAGSLPASVGSLMLAPLDKLRQLPLNLEIGFAPYVPIDDVALGLEEFSLREVAKARNEARVRRHLERRCFDSDLVNCDWDYALQKIIKGNGDLQLGIKSFIAVDSINSLGSFRRGVRPGIGNRTKKGAPRLPCFAGVRTRDISEKAVQTLCSLDLLLLNLHSGRGSRAAELLRTVLQSRNQSQPTVLLSENASEVARFLVNCDIFKGMAHGETLRRPTFELKVVGRARVQSEQEFDYALPKEDLTDVEDELVGLARAAWRTQWRSLTGVEPDWSVRSRFKDHLSRLRRAAPSSADRFNLINTLLDRVAKEMRAISEERFKAVFDAIRETTSQTVRRTLVIVANNAERDYLSRQCEALAVTHVDIAVARHLADELRLANICVACGYYGPVTIDALLRARPHRIVWILDPVEAAVGAFEAHRQAAALSQLGLSEFADVLGAVDNGLCAASGGVRNREAEDHPDIFRGVFARSTDVFSRLEVEVVDENPDIQLALSDGTALRTSNGHRFDVVRAGAAMPRSVAASDLEVGDQIVWVRGTYQRTLSELLIEDMDSQELQTEAARRTTWAQLVRIAVERIGLDFGTIVQRLRQVGSPATHQQVRAWLQDEGEFTTPRDWKTFLAFARLIEIGLPEEEVRQLYDAIRSWRIGHRKRGRDVVKILRLAWFGGLSAADLARIEERWGLGVRDLVEGSRVVDVESIVTVEAGA